jgi:hypothetical protein
LLSQSYFIISFFFFGDFHRTAVNSHNSQRERRVRAQAEKKNRFFKIYDGSCLYFGIGERKFK